MPPLVSELLNNNRAVQTAVARCPFAQCFRWPLLETAIECRRRALKTADILSKVQYPQFWQLSPDSADAGKIDAFGMVAMQCCGTAPDGDFDFRSPGKSSGQRNIHFTLFQIEVDPRSTLRDSRIPKICEWRSLSCNHTLSAAPTKDPDGP